MAGIALLLPNQELMDQAAAITKKESHIIYVRQTTADTVVNEARNAIAYGANVVVARGHQAMEIKKYTKIVKELNAALDDACKAKYAELTIDEIKELLVNRKWYYNIFEGIKALYETTAQEISRRIAELAERYEQTLPELEKSVEDYESKVKAHLERMGFKW